MEQEDLKRKIMGLWERTTHNSKESLTTLFDFYYNEKYMEYKEVEGKVVCALLGIPYNFGLDKRPLKGLYIVCLTSEEGYKKKGNLSELLQKFNTRMAEEFDFSFLVPPTELMADYFGSQDYLSSFFILEERFTPLHDFKNDYILSLTDSDEKIRDIKEDLINHIKVNVKDPSSSPLEPAIIDFIRQKEKKGRNAVNMRHTAHDLQYLLTDHNLKNLSSFIACDGDDKLTGVVFAQKEDIKRIKIVASYVTDFCTLFAILDYIKHYYPDHSMTVVTSETKNHQQAIYQQTYASENPAGADLDNTFSTVYIPLNINKLLQPLGMVRILKFDNIMEYLAVTRSDIDFKLHIRLEKEGNRNEEDYVYMVKNGKCEKKPFSQLKNDSSVLELSVKEVSELLLRKNDTSNLIMEAFGIPRLNLQIKLLPC